MLEAFHLIWKRFISLAHNAEIDKLKERFRYFKNERIKWTLELYLMSADIEYAIINATSEQNVEECRHRLFDYFKPLLEFQIFADSK